MNGLSFHRQATIDDGPPVRADVACFVGLITPRVGRPVTPEIAEWLVAKSWIGEAAATQPLSQLAGVPLPIENWAVFDGLFQWESRTADGAGGPTYLGMALRSFFSQGGRKCYVVSMGASDTRENISKSASHILPRYLPSYGISESDRTSWVNAGAVVGLEDVSYLLLPDLPELVSIPQIPPPVTQPAAPQGPEVFVVCNGGDAGPAPAPDTAALDESAPRCDEAAYGVWKTTLSNLQSAFSGTRVGREVQLIAAFPLPFDPATFGSGNDLLAVLPKESVAVAAMPFNSGFTQVCYPWLVTDESASLPEGIIPPDGALAGMLALNALSAGAYKDASRINPNQIYDTFPELSGETYTVKDDTSSATAPLILVEQVSLFGPTPSGYRLLSDVTTSSNGNYRQAPIRRLMEMLNKSARELGETLLFMPSGPRMWGRVQSSLTALLNRFWQAGALDGNTMGDAFAVRCDRSTMLQADIDAGRVIAQVTLSPAWGIESIRVTLVVSSGDVSQPADDGSLQEVA